MKFNLFLCTLSATLLAEAAGSNNNGAGNIIGHPIEVWNVEAAFLTPLQRLEMFKQTFARDACLGDNDCCSMSNPCYQGEGDCDRDEDCVTNLKCGQPGSCLTGDAGAFALANFSGTDSCCYDPDP